MDAPSHRLGGAVKAADAMGVHQDAIIELSDVGHAFFTDRRFTQAKVVLKNVNLSIDEGEFVSLVGPSGCGKTVTLSMIAGFMEPVCGEVLFKGSRVSSPSPVRGVVFQEYSLLPWLSVKGNIMFAIRNSVRKAGKRFDKESAEEHAMSALAQVGLADCADIRPNTLSGGMKQRAAIARLLAIDSEVFLMDEPFSALDEQTRSELDGSLHRLWKQRKKTIVFVTHDITEAIRISSRIVMFSSAPGTIVRDWKIPDAFDRDDESADMQELVSEIIGMLPMGRCGF